MPTRLKSQTTTDPRRVRRTTTDENRLVTKRLPSDRAPTHPGEMLLEEFLKPLGVSQSALAIRLGVSFPRPNEIVRGRRSVTPDTALRLERVVGMSADFWLGLQQDWDLWHAMRSDKAAAIAATAIGHSLRGDGHRTVEPRGLRASSARYAVSPRPRR